MTTEEYISAYERIVATGASHEEAFNVMKELADTISSDDITEIKNETCHPTKHMHDRSNERGYRHCY